MPVAIVRELLVRRHHVIGEVFKPLPSYIVVRVVPEVGVCVLFAATGELQVPGAQRIDGQHIGVPVEGPYKPDFYRY
jgi:hypothetical protein